MSKRSRRKKLKRAMESTNVQESIQQTGQNQPVAAAQNPQNPIEAKEIHAPKSGIKSRIIHIYDVHYKKLLILPLLLIILAIAQISYQVATTGDFIHKGVSLKGGVTIIIPTAHEIGVVSLQNQIAAEFPDADITVRLLKSANVISGIDIEIDITEQKDIDRLSSTLEKITGISSKEYSVEVMGSSLGASFFKETIMAILIAFVFMGIVVFICFRVPIPSLAVILAAFSDMLVTLAVVNFIGLKISTAGIAAFLMIVGYSVDTDILLSTRVLKRKGGTVFDRTLSSVKTGLMMTFTAIVAVTVALIFSESSVIKEIMTILLIGLIADMIMTWIQNAGILRWYLEKKQDVKV